MRIQIGDLVKYRHTTRGVRVHLVTEAWESKDGDGYGGPSGHIVLLSQQNIEHRADNFMVISRGRK